MNNKTGSNVTEIEQLKLKRTRERTKATKLTNELKSLYTQVRGDSDGIARDELDYNIEIGEGHLEVLENLESELKALGVEDESAHIADLHKAIGLGKRLLTRTEQAEAAPVPSAPPAMFKLDITVPRFKGDLLAWPEFWEIFEAYVHTNRGYSSVQKLCFLRQHLDGPAARAIQGLPLTADNYMVAVEILRERFGKDDIRKDSLITKLLNLPAVTSADNLKALRRLVDEVTTGVRSLEAMRVPNIGSVLLPVLKGKIPAPWRLQWARQRHQQQLRRPLQHQAPPIFGPKCSLQQHHALCSCNQTTQVNGPATAFLTPRSHNR
ncbi:uncharacterized protein LOC122386001 [Amphibalanus amphitrite]|uniref:uncharacterized protein LOC122386001 n=1 Tax=Amphibalanus amphitrite TaxID=1232801 RepID=UPI001C91A1D7|nr:uncharacterized protein LOC122386001 [Amphibalanus amphitrite]